MPPSPDSGRLRVFSPSAASAPASLPASLIVMKQQITGLQRAGLVQLIADGTFVQGVPEPAAPGALPEAGIGV
jgi:hypothetical protein